MQSLSTSTNPSTKQTPKCKHVTSSYFALQHHQRTAQDCLGSTSTYVRVQQGSVLAQEVTSTLLLDYSA